MKYQWTVGTPTEPRYIFRYYTDIRMWHYVMVLWVIMSMFWQSGSSPMVMICCCLRYKDPHLVMGTQHLTGDCHIVILSPVIMVIFRTSLLLVTLLAIVSGGGTYYAFGYLD